jgi:hypothetical protein
VSLISPPMILADSALLKARVSKLKPNESASFYARVLANTDSVQHSAWKRLLTAVDELGEQHFGAAAYRTLVENGLFRSPIRKDVAGKGWPSDVGAFLSVKAGEDYPPAIVGRDALPIMDQTEVYPGCIVRVSLRPYAYGGRGTNFGAGISFGLENVQKLADGPRFKNARGDGSEFGRFEDEDLAALIR